MICIVCSRELQPTAIHYNDDGTSVTLHGDAYVWIDGSPVCEACDYRDRNTRNTTTKPHNSHDRDPDSDHHHNSEDDPTTDSMITWCRRQQEHIYIPPGSHGGGSKCKRYGAKKSGKKLELEPWVPST